MSHFTSHVKAAIQLNKSQWQSYKDQMIRKGYKNEQVILDSVFSRLVFSERLTLLFSWFYDWRCPKGMSLSFEDIRLNTDPPMTPDSSFTEPNTKVHLPIIIQSLKNRNLAELERLLTEYSAPLKNPRHNCMLRHLIESMARAAWVFQHGQLSVLEKSVYWHYVKGHALFFHSSDQLDKLAFEIQKLGFPILYLELPHIPQVPKNLGS